MRINRSTSVLDPINGPRLWIWGVICACNFGWVEELRPREHFCQHCQKEGWGKPGQLAKGTGCRDPGVTSRLRDDSIQRWVPVEYQTALAVGWRGHKVAARLSIPATLLRWHCRVWSIKETQRDDRRGREIIQKLGERQPLQCTDRQIIG